MEYKEKPEGPFFVSFYVTNFTASDDLASYKINITDFYGNCYESNLIGKNNYRQINFPSNYIEICEETAINDIIQSCVKVDVFARNNDPEGEPKDRKDGGSGDEKGDDNNGGDNDSDDGPSGSFVRIGSENIKAFPFLHDQLIITRKIVASYRCGEKGGNNSANQNEGDQADEPVDPGEKGDKSDKKRKKKNADKDEKKKKKKDKIKGNSRREDKKSDNSLKTDIDISFHITLNINSLVGNYCGRSSYNIMNVKVDGVYNISKAIDEKMAKKNSHTFQLKFLDFSLNDGALVEDEQDKYKIVWKKNDLYKYRNIKEIEYIYNFLFYESFNVNAYLLCVNEGKKQRDNATPSVMDTLCGRFQVNISDVITNAVINAKYQLQSMNSPKGEAKSGRENEGNEESFVYGGAYILLTIQFYKPFFKKEKVEFPLRIFNVMGGGTESDKKESDCVEDVFNRSIMEGIQYVNLQIDKLKEEDQIKIYRKSKEYVSFLDSLRETPTYLNLYNNIKEIMIKLAYEIVRKKVYQNFNLHDDVMFEEENGQEKEKTTESTSEKNMMEKSSCGKKAMSEENENCILAHLFNLVNESSNVIINGYFEKENHLNMNTLREIKEKNNITDIENYLFNVVQESEFLFKYRKTAYFCEAMLVLLFRKITSCGESTKGNLSSQLETQDYNHVVNMLLHYSDYDEEKEYTQRDNYMYEKKKNKDEKKKKKKKEDILTCMINGMKGKNANSYLFHYMDHFSEVILNGRGESCAADVSSVGESPVQDAEQENIISIINLPQNEEIKKIFIDVLYTYAKTLLIMSSHPGGQVNKKQQRLCYEQYCVERSEQAKDNFTGEGDNGGATRKDQIYKKAYDQFNDNFECHNNFNSYDKYLNRENVDTCISCLSAYVELTNFENIESIFTLALAYLNAHKYEEAEKLASYLIEIMKMKKCQRRKKGGSPSCPASSPEKPPEEEPPMDMKKFHLYSSFGQTHIDVTVEICVYIKALCFYFQRNYVQYYINMSILMSTNENELRLEVEKSTSSLGAYIGGKDPSGKKAKWEETERKDKTGASRNRCSVDNVGGISGVADGASDEAVHAQDQHRKKKKKKKSTKGGEDASQTNPEGKESALNDQPSTDKEEPENKKEQEVAKAKGTRNSQREQPTLGEDQTMLNCPDTNLYRQIPEKDTLMLLFLIHCTKLNLLNIVMFIHENRWKFLTQSSLDMPLYRQLIIRAFFAVGEFAKCVELIDETSEHLRNLDFLYIYAQSSYKLGDYPKCVDLLKQYLPLCRLKNLRVKMHLRLSKIYLSLGNFEDSKKEIKNSQQICKTSYSYLYLGCYYLKRRKYLQAYRLLYKSNEMNIFNHKLWAYLCMAFLHLGMRDQADKCLGNFIKMKKYDKKIISEMVDTYKEVGYEKGGQVLSTLHAEGS
ncbi:conserved Plasmodium protein, unknown function [Plasmodium knowlesi strain H]|uniref:Tetratricopeptide repeat protein n=2 Tax=Plasmodium knowlesi (strain H) TaxID=5851 RepID=A0A5K1URZ2_PLAKH|nr:conserved Plasmodium protein, unknown function [Plasmodium knowlesi strain H]CAA9990174.1 conserved Plasmodium protein, unknown function [Plasmodium knowlesi strain H]SBO27454.1 conserved Plasmodium protein, unknown function [Plasmodium knowlesi strain H]VVS79648.1 conserved Plasmodium protein, unknown function [Plasmodium knowlesi strain H]|eukprot:XP_002258127.1 hypothetical protein, conserved in Plasmodium species [Plasmodium knowlesi strain H]